MKRDTGRFLLWLLAGTFLNFAAIRQAVAASAVGQLLNAHGPVTLERHGRSVTKQAQTGEPLREGDIVTVERGAAAQALFRADGRRYALWAGSQVQVGRRRLKTLTGAAPQEMVKIGKSLAKSSWQGATTGTLVRGGAEGDDPDRPTPTGAVTALTPTLRWEGPTTGQWTLRITERDTGERVGKAVALTDGAHAYAVPPNLLKAGVWYVWSVTAPDDHFCASSFRVARPGDATLIKRMEREAAAARRAAPRDPTADLLLAEGFANLGLLDKARAVCASAHKHFPDDAGLSALAKDLTPTNR